LHAARREKQLGQHRDLRHGPEIAVSLVDPSLDRLPGYIAALEAGWSPNTTRDVSGEQLAAIRQDAGEFLRDLVEHDNRIVTLADGSSVPRLPGRVFWIWDGAFCGVINLRFVPGTLDLPAHVSGHLGYAVVPWKRRRGYATQALALLLPVARDLGLPRVLVTCDPSNTASCWIIRTNGGIAAGSTPLPDQPGECKLLFWIDTSGSTPQRKRVSGPYQEPCYPARSMA